MESDINEDKSKGDEDEVMQIVRQMMEITEFIDKNKRLIAEFETFDRSLIKTMKEWDKIEAAKRRFRQRRLKVRKLILERLISIRDLQIEVIKLIFSLSTY